MKVKMESIEQRLVVVENITRQLKEGPTQAVIEKMTDILLKKFDDRDRIVDLELKNMSQSITLGIERHLCAAHEKLEKKIDKKITEMMNNQKEKISWGLELLRFSIVAVMFILSIKMINP